MTGIPWDATQKLCEKEFFFTFTQASTSDWSDVKFAKQIETFLHNYTSKNRNVAFSGDGILKRIL